MKRLTLALLTCAFVSCDGQVPTEPAQQGSDQISLMAFEGGNGQGATFELDPILGIGMAVPPDRPGAVWFDNCQASWDDPDPIPGFILRLPDGTFKLKTGIDVDVEIRLLWSIGTEWEEWLGAGRVQVIQTSKSEVFNITGEVSYEGETRRVFCQYRYSPGANEPYATGSVRLH